MFIYVVLKVSADYSVWGVNSHLEPALKFHYDPQGTKHLVDLLECDLSFYILKLEDTKETQAVARDEFQINRMQCHSLTTASQLSQKVTTVRSKNPQWWCSDWSMRPQVWEWRQTALKYHHCDRSNCVCIDSLTISQRMYFFKSITYQDVYDMLL